MVRLVGELIASCHGLGYADSRVAPSAVYLLVLRRPALLLTFVSECNHGSVNKLQRRVCNRQLLLMHVETWKPLCQTDCQAALL